MDEMKWLKIYDENSKRLLIDAFENSKFENVVCSPYSLSVLFGLLLSAAGGDTKKRIAKMLADSDEAAKVLEFVDAVGKEVASLYDNARFLSASAVCVKDEVLDFINEEFKNTLSDIFAGEIFGMGNDPLKHVNAWVNEKTEGMIERLLDECPCDVQAILVNAVTFNAKWKEPYEEENVCYESDFKNYDKTTAYVTKLYSNEESYVENEHFTGFTRPYEGGKYSFMALKPKRAGKKYMKEAIAALNLRECYEERYHADVQVYLPEFEISTGLELSQFCQSIGLKDAIGTEADFSDMVKDSAMLVDSIIQKAYIKVDRHGTKAAAATAEIMVTGAMPNFDSIKYVDLDRPFVYAIFDNDTGLPLFAGVVNRM